MIKNITKNKLLVKDVVFVKSVFGMFFGLMGKKKFDKGMVFIFNKENNVNFHTYFMRFAIDMLFLNENNEVVELFRSVKPWRINMTSKAKYVVELPAGKSQNTEIGDKISFK